MLRLTCERARIEDGQRILELGCGWGSLSLWLAEHYPRARITGVSNSATQRMHIEAECERRALTQSAGHHLRHEPVRYAGALRSCGVDRDVRAHEELPAADGEHRPLARSPTGCCSSMSSAIASSPTTSWHAMPRTGWRAISSPAGSCRARTCCCIPARPEPGGALAGRAASTTSAPREAWLANLDRNALQARPLLAATYGPDQARRWLAYWRVFFMACAELWGYRGGAEWQVSHYLFRKPALPM